MSYRTHLSGEDVYQAIRDDIMTLRLKPGQMISENEIAAQYHVSRTPVKTAFLRLKGERYIEIVPQKGTFITLLDMKYIRDVIYARSVLEMDMLTHILADGQAAEVATLLDANLTDQRQLIDSGTITPQGFYDIDSAFHATLFDHQHRSKVWTVIQDLQVHYTRFRILDTLTTARYEELYHEHQTIVDALRAQDAPTLATRVFDHTHGNLRVLAGQIDSEYRDYFDNDI